MKKITMFHIEECRYCDFAKKAISELRDENPEYKKVEIIKGEVDFYLIREAKPNPKARLKNKMSMLWKKETFI